MPIRFLAAFSLIVVAGSLYGALRIKPDFVTNSVKAALLQEFASTRYGMTNLTIVPRAIIIHNTETPSYARTIEYFRRDEADKTRPMLVKLGKAQVGTQFVVDRRGGIHQLYPADHITRHVTGFNHLAIGIENVAMNPRRLTQAQLFANRELVRYLVKKYPTIEYLFGHHEYKMTKLPHFSLYFDKVEGYELEEFNDPGPYFMKRLRSLLAEKGVRLKE